MKKYLLVKTLERWFHYNLNFPSMKIWDIQVLICCSDAFDILVHVLKPSYFFLQFILSLYAIFIKKCFFFLIFWQTIKCLKNLLYLCYDWNCLYLPVENRRWKLQIFQLLKFTEITIVFNIKRETIKRKLLKIYKKSNWRLGQDIGIKGCLV